MTEIQKKQLIQALIKKGYSTIDATNVANGDPTIALERYNEYCNTFPSKVDSFITEWTSKPCDVDHAYGCQCMDLMHQFCMEVLGLDQSVLSADCAKDVFLHFPYINGNQHFTLIKNTIFNIPQKGDIVFFSIGQYGHVCIFDQGNIFTFTSFDQNWPLNSLPHLQSHNYITCLGWLRFKA
jgi:hypothetical protein